MRTAYEAAHAQPVTAPEAPRQVDWPYTSFGPIGKVAERKDVNDLDAVFVRFENGVRLTVKSTKLREDQVLVAVRFGQGLENMPADHQTITWAGGAFAEGGLRQITADDAERALTGQVYGVGFGAEPDAFVLEGEHPHQRRADPAAGAGGLRGRSGLAAGGVPAAEGARRDAGGPVRGHRQRPALARPRRPPARRRPPLDLPHRGPTSALPAPTS